MPDRKLTLLELRALIHETHSDQRFSFGDLFLEQQGEPSLYDMVLNELLGRIKSQREMIAQLYKQVNTLRLSAGLGPFELKEPALWVNERTALDRKFRDPKIWEEPTGSSD